LYLGLLAINAGALAPISPAGAPATAGTGGRPDGRQSRLGLLLRPTSCVPAVVGQAPRMTRRANGLGPTGERDDEVVTSSLFSVKLPATGGRWASAVGRTRLFLWLHLATCTPNRKTDDEGQESVSPSALSRPSAAHRPGKRRLAGPQSLTRRQLRQSVSSSSFTLPCGGCARSLCRYPAPRDSRRGLARLRGRSGCLLPSLTHALWALSSAAG